MSRTHQHIFPKLFFIWFLCDGFILQMSLSIIGEESRIVLQCSLFVEVGIIRCSEFAYGIHTLKIRQKFFTIWTLLTNYFHSMQDEQDVNWDLVCVQLETILKIRILDEPEKCKSKNPSSSSPHAAFLPKLNVQVAFKSLSLHQCSCQKLEAIIVKALSAVYEMACAQGSYSDQFLHYTLDAPTCLSSRGTSMKQDKEFTLQNVWVVQ